MNKILRLRRASQRRVSRNAEAARAQLVEGRRASQRRVSRNVGDLADGPVGTGRASQRRVSRNEAAGETSESDVESRLAEARE